jgi:hypothetical protein
VDRQAPLADVVQDTTEPVQPTYLNVPFVTSTHFKKEADASGWNPRPCTAR